MDDNATQPVTQQPQDSLQQTDGDTSQADREAPSPHPATSTHSNDSTADICRHIGRLILLLLHRLILSLIAIALAICFTEVAQEIDFVIEV